ncbi:autotransporter-associated beta strand repeat-containing protein [Luteolibacter pohnpeiensis]|uniref:Autotransporter-associated beta strand repeat-containing protein n=1 Tax=Luteolibacter pohnpeiensis TaxID=454153 RepID=A0A934S293_9BACT|nr:autotransporter-associated beta strand repeat-containing protein [Luteolibacter pohnpeiensis]MBK1881081.1 autotransporter-associated beta strand repeat-containing protein [Luteolibacter pohnpeiensis]
MKPRINLFQIKFAFVATAVLAISSSLPCLAADIEWVGTTGSYSTATNWDGGVIPGGVDYAQVNNGGTIEISTDWNVKQIGAGVTAGGTGTINLTDRSLVLGTGHSYLGSGGTGTMTISGNSVLNKAGGNSNDDALVIGEQTDTLPSGLGTLNQTGGSIICTPQIWIGQGTGGGGVAGTYNISGGTLDIQNWLAVGREGAMGVINMTGGTITRTGNGSTVLGTGGGTGTINQSGGVYNNITSQTWLGEGGTAVWNLSGTGEANFNILRLGQNGTSNGTFNLDGGKVATYRVEKDAAATGSFFFNGGTLTARENAPAFMTGLTTASIKSGGAIIDTNNYNVTIAQPLLDGDTSGTGDTLTKLGQGILRLTGANTFNGNITVSDGDMIAGAPSAMPGWDVSGRISVDAFGVLGASLGDGGFTQAQFETMLSNATMTEGASVAVDTRLGDYVYTGSIGTLPNASTWTYFDKTGANTLTLDATNQVFTGTYYALEGTLLLQNLPESSTNPLGTLTTATIALENATSRTFSPDQITIGSNFSFLGDGDKTIVSNGGSLNYYSITKAGSGALNFPAEGLDTTANFISSGGAINLNGGSVSIGGESQIAQGVGAVSVLNIAEGDTYTANNWLAIGRGGGTGSVEMTGGNLIKQGGGSAFVGGRDGGASTGVFNLSGGTFAITSGELWIGQNANNADGAKSQGTFNLSADGVVTLDNWFAVGREGGIGTFNMTGGSFTKTGNGNLVLGTGTGGFGTVNQSAGTFTATGELWLGESPGTGVWNLSASAVLDTNIIRFGRSADGLGTGDNTFNLNGGTVNATGIAHDNAGVATFNFNGGTLFAKTGDTETASFMTAVNVAAVKEDGAIVDTNGFVVTFDSPLTTGVTGSADGGLAKLGEGTLRLTGANTYTGPTDINAGTLVLRAGGSLGAGQVTVASGTTLQLRESTTLAGSVQVAGTMDVLPDAASGNIAVGQGLTFASGSTAKYTFGASPSLASAVVVSGNVSLGNATLAVTGSGTYEAGTKFTLMTYSGTLQGTFAGLAEGANVQIGSTTFELSYADSKAVTLTVPGGTEPTDYADWSTSAGLSASNNGRDADPDGDGRPNFMEFALDGSPLSAGNDGKVVSKIAEVSAGVNALTITLPVRAGVTFTGPGDLVSSSVDGISYTIQASSDLQDFTTLEVTEVTPALSDGMPSLSSSDWTYRTFTVAGTSPTVPKVFLRVLVSDSTLVAP